MPRQQSYPIRAFKPVSRLEDTTDKGVALEQCRNIVLRPQDGWSGPPIYNNLWAIGVAATAQATYRALTFSGTAIGDTSGRRATNKTVAIQIARQGKNFLLLYDLTASLESACRGWFYLGDDGTYTSGAYAFTTGTPTYTVLAVGLNAAARWYGYPNQGAWFLGNGVDENVIVQLGRTVTPGIWRKAGSNAAPTAPVIALVAPATAANAQASFTVPGYTSFSLTSTANTLQASGRLVNGMVVFQDAVTLPTPLAAATSYFVKTAPSTATLTIAATSGGTQIDATADGRGDFAITSASRKVTAAHGIDTFTRVAHGLVVGDAIKFSTVSGTLPSGTFTVDPATDTFTIASHGFSGGDTVQFTTTGTLPGGLATLTTYIVKTTPSSSTFTLFAADGVNTRDITSTGTGTHSLGVIAGTKYFVQSTPTADTFKISATRGGAVHGFPADGTGDFYYTNEAYSAASDAASDTIIRTTAHHLAVNDAVVLSGTVPSGSTAGVTYYVESVPTSTTFKIKTTVAGTSPLNIGTRSAGDFDFEVTGAILTVNIATDVFTRTAHNLAVDDKFTVATVFTPLTGITANIIYFIISASYSATTNLTTFQLSLEQTGSAVAITGNTGVLSNRLWTINGTQSLTVTALSSWKAGVDGNGCFKLAYSQVSGTFPFSSTLSGTGTAANPYLYVVTGGTSNTFDEFVAFVAADPLVTGLISISASASSSAIFTLTTPGFSFGSATPYPGASGGTPLYVTISQGSGSGASEGYTSRTVTVYARYWDPGHNGHGYEGPSSAISNTLIIPNTANNDISITVTANAAAEGGRFTKIRLYMQFGEDADAVYKLITADINNSGTPSPITVGTTTVFGEDDMSVDQQRPLPHKFHAFAAEQMFRGGLIDHPDRLYASKVATVDEVAPEGCSLLAADYETISIPGTPAGSQQVTALIATAVDLQIHTLAGFAIINPVDPAQRVYPASTAGAISQSAVTIYEGKSMYYWAADLQLRTLDTARPADFASTVATSQFAALGALELLREYIDTDAILRQPDRTWVFPDAASQHIWMFAPGLDGSQIGFAYDLMGRGMVGPFSYPKIYASAQMEPGRPEIVFADEAGRLFVWDTSAQSDSAGNAFGTQSAFTAYSTSTPMPDRYAGYGYVDYLGFRYYQAYEAILETGMLDMGQPGMKKAFQAAIWRTIQDSRALVEVTFIDMAGNTEVFTYGDVNDSCNCRASLMMSDTACRVKLRIIGAEGKKWAMRDMTLLFAQQGQI